MRSARRCRACRTRPARTGNGDAHAKNFSVLQDQSGEWQVSPVYDVPCTHVYGDTTMAMPLGNRSGSEFGVAYFVQLGAMLRDLDALPFDRGKLNTLRRVIEHRRSRLSK